MTIPPVVAATRHVYAGAAQKRIDLWLGFGGWVVVVGALFVLAVAWGGGPGKILGAGLVPATLAAAIVLGVTRRFAAYGIGLGIMAVVALVVLEAIFTVIGFVITALSGGLETDYCTSYQVICLGSPATTAAVIVGGAVFAVIAFFSLRGIHKSIR